MNFHEAKRAMRDGHACTRTAWDDGDKAVPEFLFIRPEWDMNVHDLPIIKSIPIAVKRLIRANELPLGARLILTETLCHYNGLQIINGFMPCATDVNATDWRRMYPYNENP